MVRFSTFYVMLGAAIAWAVVESRVSNVLIYNDGQDIPQRCINNTVTPVSCQHVHSNDSLIPHPDDCELFYYCLTPDHAPICRQCGGGLHFNPTEHVCDYPEEAGCQSNTRSGDANP